MDKQKLITIAKDQLKGGIGEEQVRELLTYRGVETADADAIMRAALGAVEQPAAEGAANVVEKTDEVIAELMPDAPVQPEYLTKERNILVLSVIGFLTLLIVGSVIYYFYF